MRPYLLLLAFLPAILALQANLAGLVDWHKPLLGQPLLEPSPPSIVETSAGRRILAITQKNLLGALDDKGEVVWRQQLDEGEPVVSYHVEGETVLLLSGSSATYARLLSVTTGHLIWERRLHPALETRLTTPVHLGTDAFILDTSIIVLSDGRRISKLDKKTGAVLWSMDAPGAGSTVLFKQLHVSDQVIHVLALTNAFSTQTLTTFSISLDAPIPLGDFTQIPSIVTAPSDACIAASSEAGSAKVVWWEEGRLRSTLVKADGSLGNTKDLLPGKGRKWQKMLHTGGRQYGYVMAQQRDGTVDIVDVSDIAKIVDTFESSADNADRSQSTYSTIKAKDGVVFNRVYWSFSMNLAACQTYIVSRTDNQVINSGFTFPFDTVSHGLMLHAAPSSKVNNNQLVTILTTTSTGALQLVQNDGTQWTREEGLSDIAAVRFIDLGEPEVEQAGHVIEEESTIGRLSRHLVELKGLPSYIIRFITRLTSSSYSSAVSTTPLSLDRLHRDQFGFQKLVVAVTKGGKLFGLDSANGNIVWARNLGLFGEKAELDIVDMWTVREFGELGNPTLAVLAVRGGKTVAFHVDGFTGAVSGDKTNTGLPAGKELFEGRPTTSFLLPFENCGSKNRVLGVVDASINLHIFPFCKKVAANVSETGFTFTTLTLSGDGPVLQGHSVLAGERALPTTLLWSKPFSQHDIVSSSPATYDAISSFGRVTGDKSTLYKYLNPHLHVVASISPVAQQGRVSVIDIISGRVIYEAVIPSLVIQKGIIADMVENWLVYRWLDQSGWKIASVDLYEDRDQGVSPGISSFTADHEVKAVAQTFVVAHEIKSLTFTTSRTGITVKDLVYINDQGQVATIPRRLLDPRRPTGPPSKSDKEEQLIPYDPLIAPDTRRVISHKYPLLGARAIISSPALLESTSLLFTHGIDLFLTRGVNPSGTFDILSDNFNKLQLLLTLAGLSGGIFIAKPAVRRKMLQAKWY